MFPARRKWCWVHTEPALEHGLKSYAALPGTVPQVTGTPKWLLRVPVPQEGLCEVSPTPIPMECPCEGRYRGGRGHWKLRVNQPWDRSALATARYLCTSCLRPGSGGRPWPSPNCRPPGHQDHRWQAGRCLRAETPTWNAHLLAVALSECGAELLGQVFLGIRVQLRGKGTPNPCALGLGLQPSKGAKAGSAVTGGAGAGQQDRRSQPTPGALMSCHLWLSPPPSPSEPCTPVSSDPNSVPGAQPGHFSENACLRPRGVTGAGLGGPHS